MTQNSGEKSLFSNVPRSLILAGGGVRLAYHAGVLCALEESGLTFNHVDGTSGGIFCTGMLASGLNPKEIASRWRTLDVNHFMSLMPLKNYLRPGRMDAVGDADGIVKKVFPHLGIEMEKINSNTRFTATFNVCNFSRKSLEAVPHDKVQLNHLVAGVSLPIFMPALKIGNDWYTDGVWIKDANMLEAVKRGAEEIWLVWCIGNTPEYKQGSFIQYVHMIEMSANGSLLEEMEQIEALNERIRNGDSPYGQTKPIVVHVIKPAWPLPLDPDLFLGKIDTRTLINMGYRDAKACLKTSNPDGVRLDFKAALMTEPPESLNFRMQFRGEVQWQSRKTPISLFASLRVFDEDGKMEPIWYGSIRMEDTGEEVSMFATIVNSLSDEKGRSYQLCGRFYWHGTEMEFAGKLPLGSPWDFWLGLEFMKMIAEISQIGMMTHQPVNEFILIQPFTSRMKKLRTLSSSEKVSFFKRQFRKFQLTAKLYKA